jgi:hypothetical protein
MKSNILTNILQITDPFKENLFLLKTSKELSYATRSTGMLDKRTEAYIIAYSKARNVPN